MTTRIDIAALVDQYIDPDGEYGQTEWPDLWSFDIGDVKWLTDRRWMLPESRCDRDGGHFNVRAINAGKTTGKAVDYVRDLTDGVLVPAECRFAACFAGVFTLAGWSAWAIEGDTLVHALVDEAGVRAGILMPHKVAGLKSLSIPASAECVDTYKRLHAAAVVQPWQCWELAAYLTATAPVGAS